VFPETLTRYDPDATPEEPLALFEDWFSQAVRSGVPAPHAMTLATVDESGLPDARVLILKDVDDRGWHFATHSDSPKGHQLAGNAGAALTFFWAQMGRQVRVKGHVEALDKAAGARDFLARPDDSRAATLVGRQSEPMDADADYETDFAAARDRATTDPELVAPSWTVFVVHPRAVEFWQASHDRAHVRLRYRRDAAAWRRERLWP
jgi:pyridoxamine 5'-phosphate oxidase